MKLTFFIPSFFLFACLAYFIQTQFFLAPDVGYLLWAANKMLEGGNYVTDFFETNPPMILYLYLPACLLTKYAFLNLILSIRLYTFLLILISISLSAFLLNKIIKPQDKIIFYFLFYMMLFVLLFLPVIELAQREHIFMILTLPYLFLAALKLENKKISAPLSFVIGLMAGLGFALKPFFIIPLCLIELYFIINKRNLFAFFRIELLTIVTILILYLISIFILQPQYIYTILPLVFSFYFNGVQQSWVILISSPLTIFCIFVIMAYCIFFRKNQYPTLTIVLWLALVGMTMAFFIPKTAWYYHTLPAVGMAYLLMAFYFGQTTSACLSKKTGTIYSDILLLSLTSTLIFMVPLYGSYHFMSALLNKDFMSATKNLTTFINAQQTNEHSIYCFTVAGTVDCFPLTYNTHSIYAGRYPLFWWYDGLQKTEIQSGLTTAQVKNKNYLLDSIAYDLDHYQAKWIIVNTTSHLDFPYLNTNKKFKDAWQHYRYSTTIDRYQIYKRI